MTPRGWQVGGDAGGPVGAADDELGLEQQLVLGTGDAADLADEQLDGHPAHRLDRLAHGRQRRLGAVHEAESSKPTTETSSGTLSPAPAGGADRTERHRVAGTDDAVTPAASSRVAAAWAASSE